MTQYEPVIGLEVHVELNTKSKMFCRCSADYFGKAPNTHTCPVCLGLPGALPYINEAAIEDCIKIGLALNCTVAEVSRFERKNYFYPDLPKGYQISQYRWPLCVHGSLLIVDSEGKEKTIRINRVHQEEDTAKLTHLDGSTAIDFNRSSVPLVEIVTEPDFTDSSQVKDYAKKLQQIFRYLGVSNADMERGDMRLEANVSVRPEHVEGLPNYRVELKNINSFRFMTAAIEYEIKRQIEALEKGEKLTQETRGWNEEKKITYVQRSKEEAHDYRYFPDPDLPELRMESGELKIDEIKQEMPVLPWEMKQRFIEYGASEQDAKILTEDRELAGIIDNYLKERKPSATTNKEFFNYVVNKKPSKEDIKSGKVEEEIQSKKVGMIEDEVEIKRIVAEVLAENPQLVDLYKKGKLTVLQALVGGVMRKTQGKVNVDKARRHLEHLLES